MSIKHLPHLHLPNNFQFITFRTFASMDSFLRKLTAQAISNDKKQLAVDAYLDTSIAGADLQGKVLVALNAFFGLKVRYGMTWLRLLLCPIMYICC